MVLESAICVCERQVVGRRPVGEVLRGLRKYGCVGDISFVGGSGGLWSFRMACSLADACCHHPAQFSYQQVLDFPVKSAEVKRSICCSSLQLGENVEVLYEIVKEQFDKFLPNYSFEILFIDNKLKDSSIPVVYRSVLIIAKICLFSFFL